MAKLAGLWLLLVLSGCVHGLGNELQPSETDTYNVVRGRMQGFEDKNHWIVSHCGGQDCAQGDSLLFTGLAVYALPCADGAPMAQALMDMIVKSGGAIYRHPTIPDDVSLDGALGLYRGIAKRIKVCHEAGLWATPLLMHRTYIDDHGGKLNAASKNDYSTLAGGFSYILDLLYAAAAGEEQPFVLRQAYLEAAVTGWAGINIVSKTACYRTNLALLALQTVEELGGEVSEPTRSSFCLITKDAGLPTADQWCGRPGMGTFLDSFQFDLWQYRPQRCPGWEKPDGNGNQHPAVDYAVGYCDLAGHQE